MAVTVIRKDNKNIMFSSRYFEDTDELLVKEEIVNSDLKPVLNPGTKFYWAHMSEPEFHKTLRETSAKEGSLVTNLSTDPELNPEGYVKLLENF